MGVCLCNHVCNLDRCANYGGVQSNRFYCTSIILFVCPANWFGNELLCALNNCLIILLNYLQFLRPQCEMIQRYLHKTCLN